MGFRFNVFFMDAIGALIVLPFVYFAVFGDLSLLCESNQNMMAAHKTRGGGESNAPSLEFVQ